MLKTVLMLFGLLVCMTGCAFIDRQASSLEQRWMKQDSCAYETQQQARDYSSSSRYRCSGEHCTNLGCKTN